MSNMKMSDAIVKGHNSSATMSFNQCFIVAPQINVFQNTKTLKFLIYFENFKSTIIIKFGTLKPLKSHVTYL